MYSLRAVIIAAVLGTSAGLIVRSAPLGAAARPADERIAASMEQVADRMRDLTRAVERSERQIECRCK